MTQPSIPDDDTQLFELLNEYVEARRTSPGSSGAVAPPAELRAAFPNFERLLACIDSLESFSESTGSGAGPSPVPAESQPTESVEFGRYELFEELGRGGMGVVFRARQTDLDAHVALKMVLSNRFASDDVLRRFRQEARAASGLRHPNIVNVLDVGEVHGQHFLTMDLVEGHSLADEVGTEAMTPQRAARLVAATAEAVDFLHRHDIVHRDLKPSNILIDEQDHPQVTDFGLAKVFAADSQETTSGTIIGTPSYMAPEQAAGHSAGVTARSDVYSLGAILYELLTGRPPFREESPLDTLLQVMESEPIRPRELKSSIPRQMEQICLRCLEKDPTRRYSTAQELAADLTRFLHGEPVEAGKESIVRRGERWARREPALAAHLAALVMAAGVVQANFHLCEVERNYHLQVMGLLACWAIVSWRLQWQQRRDGNVATVRTLWVTADAVLFTGILALAAPPLGPLLVGYPLMIAASGMWFRVRVVWFMTFASILSYATLMLLQARADQPVHYPILFGGSLLVIGGIIAYQVQRIRALSEFYDRRR